MSKCSIFFYPPVLKSIKNGKTSDLEIRPNPALMLTFTVSLFLVEMTVSVKGGFNSQNVSSKSGENSTVRNTEA